MAHFRPADHSKGDANTIGGYMAVHDRPAAFEGSDGFSYSVEIVTDATGDAQQPFGAWLLFIKWARIGAQAPEGHVETPFLAFAQTEADAAREVGALPLAEVKRLLDTAIAARAGAEPSRRWWDVMKDEQGEPE